MKLRSTLPQRGDFLWSTAFLDSLALILFFPLMHAFFTPKSGIEINLPKTHFSLERVYNPIVLSIKGKSGVLQFWLGKTPTSEQDLISDIKNILVDRVDNRRITIILRVDKDSNSNWLEVNDLLLKQGWQTLIQGSQN